MAATHSPPAEKIRVLIVDDHAIVRQGLRTFLELQDASALPIEVVGEAANGIEAVELARRTQPDVVLLDLVMPQMDGIQATPRILEGSPHTRVVILTSFGEEDKVLPAIRAGAEGYLLKDIPPTELVAAVRDVYLGKVQLHPDVARKLMSAVAGFSGSGFCGSGCRRSCEARAVQKPWCNRRRERIDRARAGSAAPHRRRLEQPRDRR